MSTGTATSFHKPHLLIVEGLDEVNFLICMLHYLQIETVQIHPIDGINGLTTKLKVVSKTAGFSDVKRIALLVDNDTDPVARHQSIRDSLAAAGLPVPPAADVLVGTQKQVMYSTLPGPDTPGCLEDFLMRSFNDQPIAPHVDSFLNNAGLIQEPLTSRWSKSWVHSYLSTHEEPGLKIGEATRARYIDVSHIAFQPLHKLIRHLVA